MHKSDLIAEVAKKTGETKASVGRVIDAVLETIKGALKKGQNVTLIGFGTFKVTKRAARDGVNPQTGKKIKIKASKNVKFKAGAKLKAAI